ncbi:MAG TPA: protein-glutamate O-methyltransferase CheR [Gemmatimonadaceae bacterium]|nr:protein-glutamate O-methyltransferase CheR [Gemmatimonadaceae bacterium]
MSDDHEFQALLAKISAERDFRCASYKEKCLRRRIGVRLRARGIQRYADYARLLDGDAREYEKLLDTLTINVTKLFRNWETYSALAERVVPPLWQASRGGAALNVWSAGCSSGEEAYSLAVLLHQHALRVGERDRLARVRVLGTDIDRESLVRAARGTFVDAAFADTPGDLRARYFTAETPSAIDPAVRIMVRFERRDLINDPAPSPQHLIACRNVLIYFDRETQEQLFRRFHDALVPGGYLVLGKVETLLGPTRTLFDPVDARERIFQRR